MLATRSACPACRFLQPSSSRTGSARLRCGSSSPSRLVKRLSSSTRSDPSGAAPSLTDGTERKGRAPPPPPQPPGGPQGPQAKILWRRLIKSLSSLELAIGELAVIAGLSAVGTIIPQNEDVAFYMQNYPDGPRKVLGFLSYDWLLGLQLDHIYTSSYFLALNLLLGASLAACSYSRQLPMVKVARRWSFADNAAAIARLGQYNKTLPAARLRDLAERLTAKGYQVFKRGSSMYAFKGIAGRYAPIGVHVSMLLVMFGVIVGAAGGFKGSAMVPAGQEFLVADAIRPYTPLASNPSGASAVVNVDDFRITYRENGEVEQYYTDIRVTDLDSGVVLKDMTINVNEPLRFGGVTMYQTDWGIAAAELRVGPKGSGPAQPVLLPMANLEGQGILGGKAWGSFLPTEAVADDGAPPRGISMIARDLQSMTFYNGKGEFVGVRRVGSKKPLEVDDVVVSLDRMIGSTGLEIKVDPGVPFVYAGFAGMMITTLLSYISHSQVWACQDEDNVHVGGKTNRATIAFEVEIDEVLDAVPEIDATSRKDT